jgi:2-succinyl-5-enolpyruvyl-6-hydroxy-3-cyclohexene-1-carboxylate synthase
VFDRLLGVDGELSLSEPAVARAALSNAPEGSRVMVSSSMPVRDAEWFGPSCLGCEVLSNRGANGIDGVLSTAAGVALGGGATIAVLGDLAFLYDAGAMLGLTGRDLSLTVIVVDNDGGGIFSFLPQASTYPAEQFERYWGTPHGVDIASVAAGFGIPASKVSSRTDLDEVVSGAGKPGVRVAVVPSERSENVTVHQRLNAEVAAAVAKALRSR